MYKTSTCQWLLQSEAVCTCAHCCCNQEKKSQSTAFVRKLSNCFHFYKLLWTYNAYMYDKKTCIRCSSSAEACSRHVAERVWGGTTNIVCDLFSQRNRSAGASGAWIPLSMAEIGPRYLTSTGILEIIKLYFAQISEKTLIIVCPASRSSQSVAQRSDIVDVHMKQRERQLSACFHCSFSPSNCVCQQCFAESHQWWWSRSH